MIQNLCVGKTNFVLIILMRLQLAYKFWLHVVTLSLGLIFFLLDIVTIGITLMLSYTTNGKTIFT